jgi:hypothetical protein
MPQFKNTKFKLLDFPSNGFFLTDNLLHATDATPISIVKPLNTFFKIYCFEF